MTSGGNKTNELPDYCKIIEHPRRVAILVLILVFVIEVAIMLTLTEELLKRLGPIAVAFIDALLLTLVLVPCLLWLIVMPLRQLADCRRHFINWALTAEERKASELSRDLHDGIGQLAIAMAFDLKTLENSTSEPDITAQVKKLRETVRQFHNDIRILSRGLRPQVLDEIGFAAAIAEYPREVSLRTGIPIAVTMADLETIRLSPNVETALFRIAQEALTNAIRHGEPHRISIAATLIGKSVNLTISDDGHGFDVEQVFQCRTDSDRPFGIICIHERAGLLGGRAQIVSQRGQGTSVIVRIPLNTPASAHV